MGYRPVGHKESGTTEEIACTHIAVIYSDLKSYCGKGNGNLLQQSCLENSMDTGGWQATVHGVAKNQV